MIKLPSMSQCTTPTQFCPYSFLLASENRRIENTWFWWRQHTFKSRDSPVLGRSVWKTVVNNTCGLLTGWWALFWRSRIWSVDSQKNATSTAGPLSSQHVEKTEVKTFIQIFSKGIKCIQFYQLDKELKIWYVETTPILFLLDQC